MKYLAGILALSGLVIISACGNEPEPNDKVVAKFGVSGYDKPLPATIYFVSTSSKATSFLWTFGDGTTSTEASPTRVFNNIGTYFVKLVATGPSGSDSTCKVIHYSDYSDPSKPYFSYLMDRCQGVPVSVAFHLLNPNGLYPNWDFGNGAQSPLASPIMQFISPGLYPMEVSAQINGVRDTVQHGLQIN